MAEHILTENTFDEAIKDGVALVDFWAQWCGPCTMLAPIIEEIAMEYDGKVKVCKVDIDEEMNLAQKFRVVSIPTLIVFKNGEERERMIGYHEKEEIVALLNNAI